MCGEVACTSTPNPFSWAAIEDEPKVIRSCLHRDFRTTEYEILHTGGFVRLCTDRGRVYWSCQNENDHTIPDWKIHFSVDIEDVPAAWNIITAIFLEKGCDFGMKAVAGEALESWPEKQRGREITVYIFQHDQAYEGGGPMVDLCSAGSEHHFWLGPEFERDSEFWFQFIDVAESALAAAGVRSRGVAAGDLPLGRYASIRNEAFVVEPDQGHLPGYPSNAAGWNAAGHRCPLAISALDQLKAQSAVSLRRFYRSLRCASRRQ